MEKRQLKSAGIWLVVVLIATTLVGVKNLVSSISRVSEVGADIGISGSGFGYSWAVGLEVGLLCGFLVLGFLIFRNQKNQNTQKAGAQFISAKRWGGGFLALGAFGFWVMIVTPTLSLNWVMGQYQIAKGYSSAEMAEIAYMFEDHPQNMSLAKQIMALDSMISFRDSLWADKQNPYSLERMEQNGTYPFKKGVPESDPRRKAALKDLEAIRRERREIIESLVLDHDRQILNLRSEVWKRWALVAWALGLWIWGAVIAKGGLIRKAWVVALISIAGGYVAEVTVVLGKNWVNMGNGPLILALGLLPLAGVLVGGMVLWRKREKAALGVSQGQSF